MTRRPSHAATITAVFGLLAALLAAPAAAERYLYDDAGRLVVVVFEDLSSVSYEYDDAGNILSVTTTAAGVPGDADLDGDVDDADVSAVLALILAGGQPYSPTADCTGDDRVSVADLVCTINAKGGP
jgi:YD repeat-containing protein